MPRSLPCLFLLTGCTALPEGAYDTAEPELPYCEKSTTHLAGGDPTPAGNTAAALSDRIPTHATAHIAWAGGSEGALRWSFAPTLKTLRRVEQAAVYPPRSYWVDISCEDYLAVDGEMRLQSGEGLLDESLSVSLVLAEHPGGVSGRFAPTLEAHHIRGALDTTEYAQLHLSGTVTGAALQGELSGHTEDLTSGMISTEIVSIATFFPD